MSQDLSLYLLEADLPTPENWAKAIRDQGFKLKLNTDFDIKEGAGFVPCGEDVGFELLSAAMTQEEHDQLNFAELKIDWSITLCTDGGESFQIALAALGCLGSITGGRIVDQQTGEILRADLVLERAREHFFGPVGALDPATASAVQFLLNHVDHTEDGTGDVSADILLCLERSACPSDSGWWTHAIDKCGFNFLLKSDPCLPPYGDFRPDDYVGRLSCGIDMGFECESGPLAPEYQQALRAHLPQADWSVHLRAEGELNFCKAYAAISALALLTGGRVWNHADQLIKPEVALAQAKALLARLEPAAGLPDHVTAARKLIFAPVMKRLGFRKSGKDTYYRIRGRVGHFVEFRREKWDARNFYVDYYAKLVLQGDLGGVKHGRLKRTESHLGDVWPGDTKGRAKQSMQQVAREVEAQLIPFFDRCNTRRGFAVEEHCHGAAPDPYNVFAQGLGLLDDGDSVAAIAMLTQSREGFDSLLREFEASGLGARWPHEKRGLVDQLIRAIGDGSHASLLDIWYREALVAQKLRDD